MLGSVHFSHVLKLIFPVCILLPFRRHCKLLANETINNINCKDIFRLFCVVNDITKKNPGWAVSTLQKLTNLNQFLREALTSSSTKSSLITTWSITVISVPKDFWPKPSSSPIWRTTVSKIGTFARIAHMNFNVHPNCGAICQEAIAAKTKSRLVKKDTFAVFVTTRLLNKPSTTIYTC